MIFLKQRRQRSDTASSIDFYFEHYFSSSHFTKYQFSLNQNFSFLGGSVFFAVESDQWDRWGELSNQIRVFVACLQVECQFPGPSEVLICSSRRNYWYKEKDRPLHVTGASGVSPGPYQAVLGPFAGSELQSPSHQCPRALLWLWTLPALGPPVPPHAFDTEFKLFAQVEKDPDGCAHPSYAMFSSSHPSIHVLFNRNALGTYICLQSLP